MKRGDEVWLFVPSKWQDGAKILARGLCVLKNDGLWHVKVGKKFYKRKQIELAKVREEDKKLL